MTEKRHQWASNLGFILAAAGSAVGLGNIWKFPGKVGAYGGGAFLLCYLLIVFLVGFPVMLAELSIGRATQKNVVGAFRTLNPRWRFAGYIGIVTLFVILSYYCVVGGWVLKYVQIYAAGAHFGAGPGAYADYFSAFSARPVEPLLWGLGFLVLCIVVVVRGVSQGPCFSCCWRAWWSTQSPAPARGRACASCSESTPPGSAATPWWAHWDRPFFPCPWAWASW